jgi:antirestriction protein
MTTTTTTTTTPRAWVGCLGCYNNGSLIGKWLEGESCADLEGAGLAKIETHGDYTAARCVRCGGDEFAVMDHEGYGDLLGGECSPIEAQNMAQAIATIEGEGLDIEAVAAYANNMHLDVANFDEWRDDYEGAYIGELSVTDYAEQYISECGLLDGVPANIAAYFDYESYGRDLILGGDIWEHEGHLFWNR